MKKSNSMRPVRLSTFQIRVIVNEDYSRTLAETTLLGEFVTKSDVHYCAEKDGIDMVAHLLENCGNCEYTYLLYKVSKERDENDEPKSFTFVSAIYGDNNTMQVVID